ncbi:MAG TPA: MFS transporter, partial [Candidatus Desulfofervidus auxilii]|nr:MFS transporter [Candidatus Desulfofervidus auxilii]
VGASRSQIGFIYTSGALAGAVTAPFWGRLADRWGKRKILLSSMIAFLLVFLGYAFSSRYTHLFFIQVVEGMAWTAMSASATALIADVAPKKQRGEAMGIYNTAWSIGWVIGPSLGGMLSEHIDFHLTFIFCAFLMLCGIVLGFLLPKETTS